ncbi:cadmium resistance transporter [Calothrix sp. NIES-4071]|nr:cadmium resistance transporter [Calothrix sp. NIES-4071]BAZ56321.1 cadmium resistance transporter [Calothrix sp. NIES-4105]
MNQFLGAVASACAAFSATNLDDIIILTLFFAQVNANFRKRHIIIGQYLGFTVIILASLPGFFSGLVIKRSLIGLLGFLPIIIGIYQLLKLVKTKENDNDQIQAVPVTTNQGNTIFNNLLAPQIYNVAAVTFANGGDNISVYVPLFASTNFQQLLITLAVFYILIGVWCYLGYFLTRHRGITHIFSKYGHILAPIVLIGLGIYILVDSGSLQHM